MTVTYEGTGSATGGSGSVDIPIPPFPVVNDLMIASIIVNIILVNGVPNPSTITPPTGWASMSKISFGATSILGDSRTVEHFWKLYEGETGPVQFTYTNGNSSIPNSRGVIHSFRGVDTASPFENSGQVTENFSNTTTTNITVPTLNLVNAGAYVVVSAVASSTINWGSVENWTATDPGLLTEHYDIAGNPNDPTLAGATKSAFGDTGQASNTISIGRRWAVIMFALRPEIPICVIGNTQVLTPLGYIQIKDIRSSDHVIDSVGKAVNVLYNIKGGSSSNFIKIAKDSLGANQPNDDLYITEQHPLLVEDKECPCEQLVNDGSIKKVTMDRPEKLYSLCTKERIYVVMNNVNVCTWSDQEFTEFSKKKGKIYEFQ